jgi:hypothetical protein
MAWLSKQRVRLPIHDESSVHMVNVFKDMTYVSMDMVTVSMAL